MEKLIELLNEYDDGFVSHFISYDDGIFRLNNGQGYHYTLILSKEYGFIKWLVDNDKIALDKTEVYQLREICFSYHEGLLMLLSIQSNPIQYLVNILK